MIERRISPWIKQFNIEVMPIHPQILGSVSEVYLLADLFTTRNGSWEITDIPGGIVPWAREEYLKPFGAPDYFDSAGGDVHIFVRIEDRDGKPRIREGNSLSGRLITGWTADYWDILDPGFIDYTSRWPDQHSGWGNIYQGKHIYNPDAGERGPWNVKPFGAAEGLRGIGLPYEGWHISVFGKWVAVPREEWEESLKPEFDSLEELLAQAGQFYQRIQFNPNAALQKRGFADGYVPNSGEFDVSWENQSYRGQRFEDLTNGDVRIYYALHDDWDNVQWVEGIVEK